MVASPPESRGDPTLATVGVLDREGSAPSDELGEIVEPVGVHETRKYLQPDGLDVAQILFGAAEVTDLADSGVQGDQQLAHLGWVGRLEQVAFLGGAFRDLGEADD